ncbi:MAG TPA: Xaa-Pro peptidase family protein [Candidatus Eisenbacteria bacterium]|nr:Xaa-Pro peptidase family protein [Candidatus Eisenbacteria bacterium]
MPTLHVPAIAPAEYAARREALRAGMERAGLDALAVFYPARIAYLTGFHHLPTERPVAFVLGPRGRCALVVPAVEKEHAERVSGIDQLEVYFEYPGDRHPMHRVAGVLRSLGAQPRRIGADHDGMVPRWGYRGPRLSEVTGARPADVEPLVEALRRVKSPSELACIQLSCDWAGRAHRRMQAAIRAGVTEMECYEPAAFATLRDMIREMPGWRPRGYDGSGLVAMFVGGRATALPHGFVRGHGIQPGDVLVSGAGADVDGYRSELERTMIVREPPPGAAAAFAAMLALQDRAIETIGPGVPMAAIELEVADLARELGHEQHLRHHVGHSIGLEAHEAPFLDRGEEGTLEPGMVFTVEPGIYLPHLGGFRHSDTVCVTEDGCRVMTDYPRTLAELVVG